MADIEIHRTGRREQVFVKPVSPRGRTWMQAHFGAYACYGHRMQLDDQDLSEFKRELDGERLDYEDV